MKNQERLFLAIGGADPELIARSERRRGSRGLGYIVAGDGKTGPRRLALLPAGGGP